MIDRVRLCYANPTLPVAVYREVAAHLRQIDGIEAGLLPQTATEFDYYRSQVGGLWVETAPDTDASSRSRLEDVLSYYSDRFGAWQSIETES
ncbi:MAG: hypothetical protein J7641_05900 [Cyanobacteria bacterium SID2]|nr:hypothetical protein [Cyanobacteria bacterium SID2]MBP0002880.1 hypothetical protein [Cyanobacteria bacterium SBC]